MNKNLLIGLFTLICSVFAFTACSDDDEVTMKVITTGNFQTKKLQVLIKGHWM